MTRFRLPAGTDTAEMALFDVGELPRMRAPDNEGLEKLALQGGIIRFPAGGDGSYLLHLYVDERPPEEVVRYYIADDKLVGNFITNSGRIAFGGVESTFQDFKLNRFIRSDALIQAGKYSFAAYRTDIPDEVVTQATKVDSTLKERWLDRAPFLTALTSLGIAVPLAVFQKFVAVAGILVLGSICFKAIKRIPGQSALAARRDEAQLDFPSIVIELDSQPSD